MSRPQHSTIAIIREQMHEDGRAALLERAARITRIDYRRIWAAEVRAGKHGQRMQQPLTWKLDHVWRAACWQCRAEDAERLLHDVINRGPMPDGRYGEAVEVLLRQVAYEWDRAHRIAAGADSTKARPSEARHAAA